MAIQAAMPVVSLTPAENEDGNREWDVPVESPEEKLSERISLREVIDRLPPQDRLLIRLRFFGGKTQSETARVLHTDTGNKSHEESARSSMDAAELQGREFSA